MEHRHWSEAEIVPTRVCSDAGVNEGLGRHWPWRPILAKRPIELLLDDLASRPSEQRNQTGDERFQGQSELRHLDRFWERQRPDTPQIGLLDPGGLISGSRHLAAPRCLRKNAPARVMYRSKITGSAVTMCVTPGSGTDSNSRPARKRAFDSRSVCR